MLPSAGTGDPTASPAALPSSRPTILPSRLPTAPPSTYQNPGLAAQLSTTAAEAREDLKDAPLAALASMSSAAGTAVAMASVGNAGKLAALANIDCVLDDVDMGGAKPLDWEFHPVGLAWGSHAHKYFVGATFFNPVIVLSFSLMLFIMIAMLIICCKYSLDRAAALVKCPSLCYLPIALLLQGTSTSAANMALYPSRAPAAVAVLGWVMLLACFLVIGVLWWWVLRAKVFAARVVVDDKLRRMTGARRWIYEFLLGRTIWVTTDSWESYFVEKNGLFFESYRDTKHWFAIAELSNVVLLSILSTIPVDSTTTCHVRNTGICLLLGGFLLALVRMKPYTSQFENIIAITSALFMCVAVISNTIAIMIGRPGGDVDFLLILSARLLLVSAFLLILKAFFDIVMYLYDLYIGRRANARENATLRPLELELKSDAETGTSAWITSPELPSTSPGIGNAELSIDSVAPLLHLGPSLLHHSPSSSPTPQYEAEDALMSQTLRLASVMVHEPVMSSPRRVVRRMTTVGRSRKAGQQSPGNLASQRANTLMPGKSSDRLSPLGSSRGSRSSHRIRIRRPSKLPRVGSV